MSFETKYVFFVGFLGELIVRQSGILEVRDGASPILESVLLLADVFCYFLNIIMCSVCVVCESGKFFDDCERLF